MKNRVAKDAGKNRASFAYFFVTEQGEVVFNEANTIPGFTSISMYPMLWEHKGLSVFQLVNKLIGMAFQR